VITHMLIDVEILSNFESMVFRQFTQEVLYVISYSTRSTIHVITWAR